MSAREPLALVGMACRFPGDVNNPAEFWELLRNGVDAITEVPAARWNVDRFYHENPVAPGRMGTRWGGFVGNVDSFDAAFFGIAPREASRMDPQQRWLLETTWEAIEDAGLSPEQLAGSRTGVFIGISHTDYPMLQRRDLASIDCYTNIGSALSIAANRISYSLDLRGPSLAVDTACSSSLVALHLAAQSLWSGESDYAVVGGANLVLTPEVNISFSQAHMLSPRGRCGTFDADADGYVRAEGAATLLLMPLRAAQAWKLLPRALVAATATNQDGRSSGLTVPSQEAQETMIREALSSAGARAQDVVYAEAHGTGTPLGDPIEVCALAAVLAGDRSPEERLLIGSVKTNIGHLESGSGLAGLIKAVLVLEHGMVPPNLHFERANPRLPLDRVKIPLTLTPLPSRNGRAPLVAVNSFGFGGSNAHALLAPAIRSQPARGGIDRDEAYLFPLSARSPAALAQYAQSYARFIEDHGADVSLGELCAAVALGKSHHPLRAGLVADSLENLRGQLLELRAPEAASATPKIAFVFSGQGPQWWAMGRQLYEREAVVRQMWHDCDAICRKLGGSNLLESLLANEADSQLHHTDVAQPALFALQAGLTELWRAWGIDAAMVLGHSVGEAAAAWAAGIFTLEEIFLIIIARSRWQAKTHGLGRMLAASMSEEEGKEWERKFGQRVVMAASNAPQQITLSGDVQALEEIAAELKEREVFCRFLPTEYAFHSPQMNFIETGLRAELAGVGGSASKLPMISTVTGESVAGPELDADYWWRNVRQPVRFAAAVEKALHDGCTMFLEIGPHPVMASALAEIVHTQKSHATSLASLRRGEDERRTTLNGLAILYRRGATVRWSALYQRPARALRLPAYPWQRQRLWHEFPGAARELRSAPPHPLLGDRQLHPQPTWVGQLDARLVPWLADHRISGSVVVPAAAYIEMAAAAVREFLGEPIVQLEDVRFHHLLFLSDERPVQTCVRLDPRASSFQVLSANPDRPNGWELQAEGIYRPGNLRVPPPVDLDRLRAACPEEHDPQVYYRQLSEIGQTYGPTFQGMKTLRMRRGEAVFCDIAVSSKRDSEKYLLYPPALDCCFHSGFVLRRREDASAYIIVSIGQIRIFQPLPDVASSSLQLAERWEISLVGDLTLSDRDGNVVAQINQLKLRALESGSKVARRERKFYRFDWEPQEIVAETDEKRSDTVILFADRGELAVELWESLRKQGCPTVIVVRDAEPSAGSNENVVAVNLRECDWAARLWQTLATRGFSGGRVLYLWSCEDEDGCVTFLELAQTAFARRENLEPARWLVVTKLAQAVGEGEAIRPVPAALWGFIRSVQTEYPQSRISLADRDDALSAETLLRELFASGGEPEVALRSESRWVRRLRQSPPRASAQISRPPAYALQIEQVGRVDSLQFSGVARPAPGSDEVEIEIAAAGLNFRDLMKALGIYPLKEDERVTLGDEFAGRVVRVGRGVRKLHVGDRVMGFAPSGGAFASHLILPAKVAWRIPPRLSFAEAASIPVAFGTAYHALHTLARLRAGETILIHAAAGGVGLAAVKLAQKIGAVILATAGSEEKREYLRSLGVAQVMDSRTLDFADETLRFTNGRGADVALNSLAGAFQQKSLAICAPHGRFVEIGKRDLFENNALPLAAFQRSLSFFAFDLTSVFASNGVEQRALRRFLTNGWSSGKLTTVTSTTLPASDAISAFRQMQTAQHIGKLVLEFQPDRVPEIPSEFWPNPDGTYLVTGGLGGFGLATARWLVERGARHVALLSRRGIASTHDLPVIEAMRASGASITALAVDVADAKSLGAAFRRLKKNMPLLRGVFHSAMVLRDRLVAEMTQDDLRAVLAPKVAGAWNLHQQTRDLSLDCFVLYSSISSIIGAPGHANYAAANAFLDALAHHRRADGLPGLSVNWGQIADVGVAAERPEVGRYLEGIGVSALPVRDALAALPRLIASAEAQVGVMDIDWEKLSRASAKFTTSPIFRDLAQSGKATGFQKQDAGTWREMVRALPADEQASAVSKMVVAQVAATLGMTPGDVDPARPLAGMDSLMAVELKVRIEDHSGCQLPIETLNADLTADRLAERLLNLIGRTTDSPGPTTDPPARAALVTGARPESATPLLRTESTPLLELIRVGKLAPLAAGALMPWPITLFQETGVAPEEFFARLYGDVPHVSLNLILETDLGPVGIFMLPLTTSQVTPGEPSLLPFALEGIRHATSCGARCVALTGLIPSATNYGAMVRSACEAERLAAITTGHGTTVAAVILNLSALLQAAERHLEDEVVMFYGIGSIGTGALRLMLDVLPHPAELHLCDPFRGASFFVDLEDTLRRKHDYRGRVRVVKSLGDRTQDIYEASVIVGATNVENVIDVSQLAPGTLIVDDSSPHCLNGRAAFTRFHESHDILFTEGGFIRGSTQIPRIIHVPPDLASNMQTEIPKLFLSMLRPEDITGCVLSAIFSAQRSDLAPTVGLVDPGAALQHWHALNELEFTAARLNYEGTYLDPLLIEAFREKTAPLAAGR